VTIGGASLLVAGIFALGLGFDAPGTAPLRRRTIAGGSYQLRRRDVLGLSWVMSNAASYVLVSIGVVDLSWVAGWRGMPLVAGAWWIAGWWAIRGGRQLVVGRRTVDLVFVTWFAILAALHVAVGLGWHGP
jgi:hypothetical protein